jgi:chromosome segregation protein
MPYIKKMVMHGFKSFARKTEILFEKEMNVIVGPNGSGKSNITDALCFALGRLSIKSIRAAKAANLLFSGNKQYKASQEASVELIFDNTDKTFAIDSNEISIKRIVRKNGQSIYRINNQTKTRQELLELLAQAGIDPNGFNIMLQGEIASLIKATSEDRRKIIEEVAGISIYETRKHKSLRELEKTDEKLKEVSAILKERSSYLRNLDKERQDALNYQRLELTIKKCQATILDKEIKNKQKEISNLDNEIENQKNKMKKIKNQINEKNSSIEELREKINQINEKIQSSTGGEQETLHKEISDLKAELAGMQVRRENFETRLEDSGQKISEIKQKKQEFEKQISEIKTSSPKIKEKQTRQKELQEKFDILEKQRRKFYILKSEISTLENQKEEKQKTLIESQKELQLIEKNISSSFEEIKYAKSISVAIQIKNQTKNQIEEIKNLILNSEKNQIEKEKRNAVFEQDIKRNSKLKQDITKLDICPLCKSKITEKHIEEVLLKANQKINSAKNEIEKNILEKDKIINQISEEKQKLSKSKGKLNEIEIDLVKLKNSEEKKEQIKKISYQQEETKNEMQKINSKLAELRQDFEKLRNIEEKYDETRFQLQEISFTDIDIDTETSIKKRELNRLNIELKTITRDIEESENELKKINKILEEKSKLAEKKEIEEQKLYEKAEKFFSDRNELQDKQKAFETNIIGLQHTSRIHEEKINNIKIQNAQLNAQLDSLKTEFNTFEKIELIQNPIDQIKERLQKSQFRISQLGNVNLKSLEVYEKIKEQCQEIQEKAELIEKEKEKVMKIIAEIDKKKKRSFVKTLQAVNQYFTRNFSQLSRKGEVFLELENKQDPFAGGLNILIKVGRGKYFDITSLSGGEKTLVALSLIFAIQEYKPYCFYILDEIDAALDKHNSELLAALIKKYLISGQYIIITHNDALISEATTLYGISMQENLSKVISLKI